MNSTVYIPIYGTLMIWSNKSGYLGKAVHGYCLGEEGFFDRDYRTRYETAHAIEESAVLALER